MTLSTTTNTATYTGNDSTTAFSFPYLFFADGDLTVTVDGTARTLNGAGTYDFTVSGAGDVSGGTVTINNAPTSGMSVVIQRIVDYTQETDFENFDGNPADVTEKQFDLVVMQAQQLSEQTDRTILSPIGTSLTSNTISGTIDSTTRVLTISSAGPETATITSFGDLSVIETGSTNGDLLQYNGTNWVNVSEIDTAQLADDAVTAAKIDINGATDTTIVATDEILFGDISDSNNVKKDTVQGILDLVPASGMGVLLGSHTASNATSVDIGSGLDLDAVIDGTYYEYLVIVSSFVPATDNVNLHLRTSTNGGSSFDSGASDYTYFAMAGNAASATASTSNSSGAAQIILNSASGIGGDAGEASMFEIRMSGAATTNDTVFKISSAYVNGAGQSGYYHGTAQRNSAADVDALRILASSGNISGEFYLYGIKKT